VPDVAWRCRCRPRPPGRRPALPCAALDQIGPDDHVDRSGFILDRAKIVPLAVAGRCRTVTMPQARTRPLPNATAARPSCT
jgi:hypothetical protein